MSINPSQVSVPLIFNLPSTSSTSVSSPAAAASHSPKSSPLQSPRSPSPQSETSKSPSLFKSSENSDGRSSPTSSSIKSQSSPSLAQNAKLDQLAMSTAFRSSIRISLATRIFFQDLLNPDPQVQKTVLDSLIPKLEADINLTKTHFRYIIILSKQAGEPIRTEICAFINRICADHPDLAQLVKHHNQGASQFFDVTKLSSEGSKAFYQSLQRRIFLLNGRISHIDQVMGLHPAFLKVFYNTYNQVMHGPGPLPPHVRSYIALLAASQHYCDHIIRLQAVQFHTNRGNPDWLNGFLWSDEKIKKIMPLNESLCHRPWDVTPEMIGELMMGHDPWTVSEVCHLIVILALFHSLSGFVHGCGITNEPELETLESVKSYVKNQNQLPENESEHHDSLVSILHDLKSSDSDEISSSDSSSDDEQDQSNSKASMMSLYSPSDSIPSNTPESSDKEFQTVEKSEKDQTFTTQDISVQKVPLEVRRICTPFRVSSTNIRHLDFNQARAQSKSLNYFLALDHSWRDFGYPCLEHYLRGTAEPLETEFEMIYSLTYQRVGTTLHVNTKPLRTGIWHYVQFIKGIYSDYNYHAVNATVRRCVKNFVKKVSCYPETISINDWDSIGLLLDDSEKVHINIIVMGSRKQAEILYGLRAVSEYMNLKSNSSTTVIE